MRPRRSILLLALAALLHAHVGSPDIFYEGMAGPYRLLVTIRPPLVIPGVAEIEIRAASADVRELRIVPLPLTGTGAQFAPKPDVAQRSKQDPRFFTGALWMMGVGSWQVRITADGAKGTGELSVPVPTLPIRTKNMGAAIGALLLLMMLLLAAGLVSIVGAGVREGQLEPGQQAPLEKVRRARIMMGATAVFVAALVYFGNQWWGVEAANYSRLIYKPLEVSASLAQDSRLTLRIADPGWLRRRLDDLIPDHAHLMHMFLIRSPEMDRIWHLHPDQIETGTFEQNLPALPAGKYQIFADIVHGNGIPDTLVTTVDLPEVAGKPLVGDDAGGSGPALADADYTRRTFALAGGGRMVWEQDATLIHARQVRPFRFRVEDANGRPAEDLELYMGMQGHAAFVSADRSVFAHVHPSGSVPMAALSLASSTPDPHAMHGMTAPPPVVSFPFGLPKPGEYRIFVQIKRAGRIETAFFDAHAE